MSEVIGSNDTVLVVVTTEVNSFPTERRFATNLTIGDLKARLELITGASNETMKLQLLDNSGELVAEMDDNLRDLKSYLSEGADRINIQVIDNTISKGEFEDVSRVEKFEISKEDYEKRTDSVLAFKLKNKMGRFGQTESGDKMDTTEATDIKVGQRCEVSVKGAPKRRGTVRFVGNTHFKAGVWIGVQYDEPLGKNDGSVDGKRYFECKPKYGGFLRPSDITVGDFPEELIDFDE